MNTIAEFTLYLLLTVGIGYLLAKRGNFTAIEGMLLSCTPSVIFLVVVRVTHSSVMAAVLGIGWALILRQVFIWRKLGWRKLSFPDAVALTVIGIALLQTVPHSPEPTVRQFFVVLGWLVIGLSVVLFLALFFDSVKLAEKIYKPNIKK